MTLMFLLKGSEKKKKDNIEIRKFIPFLDKKGMDLLKEKF